MKLENITAGKRISPPKILVQGMETIQCQRRTGTRQKINRIMTVSAKSVESGVNEMTLESPSERIFDVCSTLK
ncbi:hypothetical protein RB195_025096 [Necator americanus]|uniref:Uncharacterized protein n=1 Tax=Necator americanus TaxID=51031 RepID=A0ABR1EQZ3_NECAM